MADLAELERQLKQLYKQRRWGETEALLRGLESGTNPYEAAWAKMMLGIIFEAQSSRHLRLCLQLTDEAMALVPDDRAMCARLLVGAMRYAQASGNQARYKAYAQQAVSLLEGHASQLGSWATRLMIHVGHYFRKAGQARKALAYYEQAINRCHSEETDKARNRRCHLEMARYAVADLLLEAGLTDKARGLQRKAIQLSEVMAPDGARYVEGRLALKEGRFADAEVALRSALELAQDRNDTPFVLQIVSALAEALAALGKTDDLKDLVLPRIKELADGKLYTAALSLQLVMERVTSGEESLCGSESLRR